ncbi:PAS domain-containing sensor histidine kinase [Bacillus sp. B1-b2]|uniref:PAS domain-containing sensor histidine kinase n=1 Tax=Bacillus sp. B1-b2 TaxID=2653201 RepID=UPI0012621E4F|nr:PAS domain-containing sensor histidine kinase [Bacillus sp. B1-b2]KAB7669346.1 PAS domain S-box protein [Bacillus sp. B1-b2]
MSGISYTEENSFLRKRIKELEEENAKLRHKSSIENNRLGFVLFNYKGVILDISPSLCSQFLVKQEDVIGRNITHFIEQEERYMVRERIRKLSKSSFREPFHHILPISIRRKKQYLEMITAPLPESAGYITIIGNVTREVEENQKRDKKEVLYNEFFTEALDGIVLWSETGNITAANRSALKIFESTLENMLQSKISDYVYKKDEKYMQMIIDLYKTKSNREELLFLMPNGQKKILEFTTKLHSVEGLHMSIFRNVTERYKMEQALRESKVKFESIFEEVFDGIIIWDENYQIKDMNKAAERLLNEQKEEVVGRHLLEYLPPGKSISEDIKIKIMKLNETGQNRGIYTVQLPNRREEAQFEYRNKHKIYDGLSITTLRDITEYAVLEEQLRKSSTLNVVGELAAGIAHEIRNPMTALKGFIQLLESGTVSKGNEMYFSVIKSELNRIESIVNEFLLLAKPQTVQFVKSNIVQIMNETIELLNAQAVLHNVQFQKEIDTLQPSIYCEPNQMKKVFINIIKNAIEVLEDGGNIKVSMQYKEQENYYHIKITDNGKGMSKEKIERLGEPFYTTKEKGTGLGLLVSYQIIEEHKGRMEVESEVGVGTTFHIYLPNQYKET